MFCLVCKRALEDDEHPICSDECEERLRAAPVHFYAISYKTSFEPEGVVVQTEIDSFVARGTAPTSDRSPTTVSVIEED